MTESTITLIATINNWPGKTRSDTKVSIGAAILSIKESIASMSLDELSFYKLTQLESEIEILRNQIINKKEELKENGY